jgi:hypothetical protein
VVSKGTTVKNYKLKQLIYNKTQEHDDLIVNIQHKVLDLSKEDRVSYLCQYFTDDVETVFPAKSYAVAIIYASLLNKYFGADFKEELSDPDLFLGTDKYFVPYSVDHLTYDLVIDFLELNNLWNFEENDLTHVSKSVEYFFKEFMWEES